MTVASSHCLVWFAIQAHERTNKTKQKAASRRVRKNKSPGGVGDTRISSVAGSFLHPTIHVKAPATEVKFVDTTVLGAVPVAGSITKLSTVAQGVGASQRIGDEAALRAISIRGYVAGAAAAVNSRLRVIVFQWNEDDALGAPVVGSIIQGGATVYAPYNYAAIRDSDFRVLFDRLFAVDPIAGPGTQSFFWEKKIDGRLAFNAAVTTGSGMLYLLLISDLATTSEGLTARVLYTDS